MSSTWSSRCIGFTGSRRLAGARSLEAGSSVQEPLPGYLHHPSVTAWRSRNILRKSYLMRQQLDYCQAVRWTAA